MHTVFQDSHWSCSMNSDLDLDPTYKSVFILIVFYDYTKRPVISRYYHNIVDMNIAMSRMPFLS